MLREAVALEYDFRLYRQYSEPEAAFILRVDLSTLKRWRRANKAPGVNMGERQVRYWGYKLADFMLLGEQWRDIPDANSN
ncbi:hypothetical protein [Mesorhizobium sp. BR-1-1-10]|uniref:hypothetical protein n=1 Tax=Mesorhizobium sp. BR-1-1-10 TaxID=2876660 RepID=UPI001CD12B33|nr:hypothetical protein [Mesorhizobium sp. BR-1-1-10]MBZ9975458.1 hypothetical protein [Mesorhizobium sp. BR-1-1-10]